MRHCAGFLNGTNGSTTNQFNLNLDSFLHSNSVNPLPGNEMKKLFAILVTFFSSSAYANQMLCIGALDEHAFTYYNVTCTKNLDLEGSILDRDNEVRNLILLSGTESNRQESIAKVRKAGVQLIATTKPLGYASPVDIFASGVDVRNISADFCVVQLPSRSAWIRGDYEKKVVGCTRGTKLKTSGDVQSFNGVTLELLKKNGFNIVAEIDVRNIQGDFEVYSRTK